MFRRSSSTAARTIALAISCALAHAGCSPERAAPREETHADGSAATRSSTTNAGGPAQGPQLEAVNATPKESIEYAVPEGWSPTTDNGIRRLAFQLQEGPLTAEMTVMGLPGSATQLLANVNLWRRQVGLEDTTQPELDAALKALEVGSRRGHYIELVGPSDAQRPRTMLVVLTSDQDRTWFFRMLGDSELVLREKERFGAFVRSVKFVPAGGDTSR